MIKPEMLKFGVSATEPQVYEVEMCEYDKSCGTCVDSVRVVLITADETEARACYETEARLEMDRLNEERQSHEKDTFYGLRLNRYILDDSGEYQSEDGDEYWGAFEEEIEG